MGRNTYVLLKFCQVMYVALHSHVICTGLLAQPVTVLRRALIPVLFLLIPLGSLSKFQVTSDKESQESLYKCFWLSLRVNFTSST